jgi:hypothetical protein
MSWTEIVLATIGGGVLIPLVLAVIIGKSIKWMGE